MIIIAAVTLKESNITLMTTVNRVGQQWSTVNDMRQSLSKVRWKVNGQWQHPLFIYMCMMACEKINWRWCMNWWIWCQARNSSAMLSLYFKTWQCQLCLYNAIRSKWLWSRTMTHKEHSLINKKTFLYCSLNLKSASSFSQSIQRRKNPPSMVFFFVDLTPDKVSVSQITQRCRFGRVMATRTIISMICS